MDGVRILTEIQPDLVGVYFFVAVLVFGIIMATWFVAEQEYYTNKIPTIIVRTIITATVVTLFILTLTLGWIKGERSYSVIIDDGVNFVEFNNKYRIVGKNGELYTVEEREEKEETNSGH